MKKTLWIYLGLLISSFLLDGCAHSAGLTICIADAKSFGQFCSKDGNPKYFVPWFLKDKTGNIIPNPVMDQMISMPANDARTLIERLKLCEDKSAQ